MCAYSVDDVSRDGADNYALGILARPDMVVASTVVEPTSYVAVVPDVENRTVYLVASAGVCK